MTQAQIQRSIGNAIRKHRSKLGMSQEQFADCIEMHRAYYSAIERGEKNLQLSTLSRICAGLGVSLWEIMNGAGV